MRRVLFVIIIYFIIPFRLRPRVRRARARSRRLEDDSSTRQPRRRSPRRQTLARLFARMEVSALDRALDDVATSIDAFAEVRARVARASRPDARDQRTRRLFPPRD